MKTAQVKRTCVAAFAALGWLALVLQFILSFQIGAAKGLPPVENTIRFFSYFTIEVNILVALVLTAFAIRRGSDEWLVHPFVRSAVAVYIAMVSLIYAILLSDQRPPGGLGWIVDFTLHDIMPAAYLAFWLVCVRKAGLRWYDPLLWLIYPLIYLAVILVRGKISGFYPYFFIDVPTLGYAKVASTTALLMVGCAAMGAILVVIGRWLARRQNA